MTLAVEMLIAGISATKMVSVAALVLMSTVYFLAIAKSYKQKRPIMTRGGKVDYVEQPKLYIFLHLTMACAGAFVILLVLTMLFV